MTDLPQVHVRRLVAGDRVLAREAFDLLSRVFDNDQAPLSDRYLDRLLASRDFWVVVAVAGDRAVGALTAHTLAMTTTERSEVFLFDIAVDPAHQRLGIGGRLVDLLRREAADEGIDMVFVAADVEDVHALDFYRAIGAVGSDVVMFELGPTT
jgi:aminoglycoside 3-N-acetyltransferase I